MNARDLDPHDADAPIFDPTAFRLDRDEAELIDAARRFGHRALAPRVDKFIRGSVRDDGRASDLLQETFLELHRSRHTYLTGRSVVG